MHALTEEQIDQVSGAIDWADVGIGVGIAVAGATFVVATGGAGVPITLVAMAGTSEMSHGGRRCPRPGCAGWLCDWRRVRELAP